MTHPMAAQLLSSRRTHLSLALVALLIGCSSSSNKNGDTSNDAGTAETGTGGSSSSGSSSGSGGGSTSSSGGSSTSSSGGGSTSSSGGGSSSGSTDGGTPPPPAAAAGYNTQTFGPQITLGTTASPTTSYPEFVNGANWVPYTFTGTSWTHIGVVQNGDGSITVNGDGEAFGNGVSTAAAGNPGANAQWTGTAFGGGGYFEAVMAFTGPASFWANDIETMNGVSIGNGPNPWPGEASGYGDWIETDFAEFDSTGVYGFAIHNWYGQVGSNDNTSTTGSGSPVTVAGADYTKPNKYGFLWVPATSSTQGYAEFYFNETQVGNTITWDKYDSTLQPAPAQNNAGTGGSNAYSVLDTLHLSLILGGSSGSTNTIYSVSVWQASAKNNLSQ
jgi:hypothetical protein